MMSNEAAARHFARFIVDLYRRLPPICSVCGVNRADPPSRLCPGCQAYAEHQR